MIYWKKLQEALDEHRKESMITCSEDCWCWHVEAAIAEREAAQQSVQRTCAKSPDGNHHFEPGETMIICEYCGASR
jgi:hypothetical protein